MERLTERLGKERAAERDVASAAMQVGKLHSAYKQAPAVAVAMLDAGKAQFREEDSGPGVHGPHWGDTKAACLQTYSDVTYDKDPQPEPPEKFLDPERVEQLCREMERVRGPGGRKAAESKPAEQKPSGKKASEKQRPPKPRKKPKRARKHRRKRPERLVRTVVASTAKVERNRERMDYPRYRRMGLPISSALVESLIKQVNYRVKGSEQFWNRGGLEAVLQVRAAYLSQDGRGEDFHERRPRGPAVGRNRAKLLQPTG